MASSARAPRSGMGTPAASKSDAYSPPTPTPSTSLPPDARSRSATCFATSAGGYSGSKSVAVPRIADRLCSTSRASQAIGSGAGFGDAIWPPTHSDEAPAASSLRTSPGVPGATKPTSTGEPVPLAM